MENTRLSEVLMFIRELERRGGGVIDGDRWLEASSAESRIAEDLGLVDTGTGWRVHTTLLDRGRRTIALNASWTPGQFVIIALPTWRIILDWLRGYIRRFAR